MPDPKHLQKTALILTRAVGSPLSIVIHSLLFVASFALAFSGLISFDRMLLILTTIVSLEAIYLAIFIQMTLNFTTQAVAEVSEDIEDIQEDIGEIQEDVGEIQTDVDELQEDVEEMTEEETEEEHRKHEQKKTLSDIASDLKKLMQDIEHLKEVDQI